MSEPALPDDAAPDDVVDSPRGSKLPFPVVGLGASAGGLEAALRFFEQLPSDSGMAFVVVTHLGADHESALPLILRECAPMPVHAARDGDTVAPGHTYVLPHDAVITIAGGRVTPSEVTIAVGQSVTFVNTNGRTHAVSSDPHPTHTDCPQVNAVGNLQNGQTRLTNAFTTARSCGFHDHDDPDNANLRGRINIQ